MLPDFKTYHKAAIIQRVVLMKAQTHRSIEQISTENNSHKYSQLITLKISSMEKGSSFKEMLPDIHYQTTK